MKSFINRTGNPVDALICAVAFCIPLWPLGTIVMTMLWLAVSIITFNFTRFKQGFKDKPYLLIFIGFFLIHVVGLVWTQNIEHGFKELKDDLNLLIFPLLFGFHRPKAGSYRFIAKGFVAGTILGTLICFVQGFYFSIHTGDWGHMFYALFSALLHPTYFGMILIVSVMMVLVEFFEKRDTNIRYKYLLVFLVLLQMAAISLLSSRIVYLVAIALFFYFIFIMMMKRKYDYMRNAYVLFMTVCS
ncbi:MAG TPA: hypothetical protein PKK99_14110, partial [Bacteroidia bacterium]|nr:hypothetical protein [Bacteroidia bacterium]